uniref:Putative AraC-like transcriptional regulator n=1 Tax=Rhodococcus opacus TaxID=37919 RepID=A0A069B0C4_RHOOP|nr:putative AraC-like transcriptional regulator [Rhodococcus opacus]
MTMASTITETQDWDAASRAVAGAYFPHTLTDLSPNGAMKLSMRTVDLGPVTLGRLGWGADVSIECDYPDAYEINIPLSGSLESCSQGDTVLSRPGQATVFRADEPTLITRWSGDCSVLGVKFDSAYLEQEADRILGSDLRPGLHLPSQIDLTEAPGHSWFRLVRSLTAQLREPADLLANRVVGPQLAGAITSAFVLAVTPDEEVRGGAPDRESSSECSTDSTTTRPAPGRQPTWPSWRVPASAGCRKGFASTSGAASECLLDIRLSRADADLRALEPGVTVSEVAARWGFTHAGRFSAAYRRRYGKSPSELIRF